jgi:hypothetical protein
MSIKAKVSLHFYAMRTISADNLEIFREKIKIFQEQAGRGDLALAQSGSPVIEFEPTRPEYEVSSLWNCAESPIGLCEYYDIYQNRCVHCGQPGERK